MYTTEQAGNERGHARDCTVSWLLRSHTIRLVFLAARHKQNRRFDATSAYMATDGVPKVGIALVVTIVLQIGGGTALIIG